MLTTSSLSCICWDWNAGNHIFPVYAKNILPMYKKILPEQKKKATWIKVKVLCLTQSQNGCVQGNDMQPGLDVSFLNLAARHSCPRYWFIGHFLREMDPYSTKSPQTVCKCHKTLLYSRQGVAVPPSHIQKQRMLVWPRGSNGTCFREIRT